MNLRRTLLITPASDGELVRKGRATDADVLFLDLEDAIPSEEKENARAAVVDHLTSELDADDDVAVRINGVETPWWYEDVIETVSAAGATIDSLILPKVTGERHLHAVDLLLKQVETNAGLDGDEVGLIPQLESTAGINNAISIARSVDRLTALMFGPGDYAASVGVRGASGEPESGRRWEYARSRIVNAAREVGIQAIDGMYPETGDVEGFREACRRAQELGFDGKTVVHPNQVTVANEIFLPSPEEIQRARRIYESYTASERDPHTTVKVDGRIIDEETFRMAEEIIERAQAAGELDDG